MAFGTQEIESLRTPLGLPCKQIYLWHRTEQNRLTVYRTTPIEDGAYETRWKQDMSRDKGSMAQEARQAQEAEEHHEKSTEIGGCSRLISGGPMAAVAESVKLGSAIQPISVSRFSDRRSVRTQPLQRSPELDLPAR